MSLKLHGRHVILSNPATVWHKVVPTFVIEKGRTDQAEKQIVRMKKNAKMPKPFSPLFDQLRDCPFSMEKRIKETK